MPRQTHLLRIFLASPGDVSEEREAARRVVEEANRNAIRRGVILQIVGWETDTFPQLGNDPQAIVNAQIFEPSDYDLFVGIMWNRFGSPTPRADAGTEEEFRLAVAALKETERPHIMFYFCNRPTHFERVDALEQKQKVILFKEEIRSMGLTSSYSSAEDFETQFRKHLLNWLDSVNITPMKEPTKNQVSTPALSAGKKQDVSGEGRRAAKGSQRKVTKDDSLNPPLPAPNKDLPTNVKWLGHLTDEERRNSVTGCLKKIQRDPTAANIIIALDFCSFGAFGDFATFKRQANLIKAIGDQLHGRDGSLRVVVNSPGARRWQLEQYFSEAKWQTKSRIWKKENISHFANHERASEIFDDFSIKQMLGQTNEVLTREKWINLRMDFEKFVEDDYQSHDVIVTRYPGIVPFHAWLCGNRKGTPYGVFALCHHQTAATAELVFSIEGEGTRHLIQLADKLFTAEKPPASILGQMWDGV